MYDIELRYVANYSVCAFHAACHVLRGGELRSPELTSGLRNAAAGLNAVLDAYGLPLDVFARHAPPLAGQIDNNLRLGNVIFRKCGISEENQARDEAFARAATQLEREMKTLAPDLLDELEAFARPLRAEWSEWGPRLLTGLAHQTNPQMLAPRADVFISPDWTGAGGTPFVPYNSVLVEVTAAAEPLQKHFGKIPPRVMNMAWCLSQLNIDLPMYAENLRRGGNEVIGALATIPAMLAAAELMGEATCSQEAFTQTLATWRPELFTPEVAKTAWTWWQTYITGETSWAVALIALDRMLHPVLQTQPAAVLTNV